MGDRLFEVGYDSSTVATQLNIIRPDVAVDHQVSSSICSMWTQEPVHEVMEGGCGSEQAKRKYDKMLQTVHSGEGSFFLDSGWQH